MRSPLHYHHLDPATADEIAREAVERANRETSPGKVMTTIKSHDALSPEDQKFNNHMQVRPAGCDEQGNFLGSELLDSDIRKALSIEEQLLVNPHDIARQMETFTRAMQQNNNDYSKLSPEQFSFLQLGGHIWRVRDQILKAVCTGPGYLLLMEHVADKRMPFDPATRVPLAYNYGFTSMPSSEGEDANLPLQAGNKPDDVTGEQWKSMLALPSLDAAKIGGRDNGFVDVRELVWTIWRAGVVKKLDKNLIQEFSRQGVHVPASLHGISARRRGLNNAFKIVLGTAATSMNKKWITYNTASMQRPDEVMDGSLLMENRAIIGSNEGVFYRLSRYIRTHVDKIIIHLQDDPSIDQVAAEVHWDMWSHYAKNVLVAEMEPDSVVNRKGGFDADELSLAGGVLAKHVSSHEGD